MQKQRSANAQAIILTLVLVATSVALPAAHAEKVSPPKVPDVIRAHSGEEVALLAHASGSQIYTCQAGADGKFSWTLKAPDAELKDQDGKIVGSHFAGPTWKLKDGSEVTGKAVARVDSDEPSSIQWLLVEAVNHNGDGLLKNVTTIQRVNTHGGKAPASGCDESHRDAETKSSYTADYYFYTAAK
jgi:hypothetical protein